MKFKRCIWRSHSVAVLSSPAASATVEIDRDPYVCNSASRPACISVVTPNDR